MSEEKPAAKRRRRAADEAVPPEETAYTLAEHQLAAAAGAYGESVRPEHIAGAWVGCYPGSATLTRAEMLEALDDFRQMPV